MNFIEIIDPEINVDQIMTEIKARVEEKKKNPAYAADIERFEKEQKIYRPEDESLADLEFLENNYDTDSARPLFSHRPVIGKMIIKAKNMLYYLVHDVFELTIQNQVIFNFFTAKNVKNLTNRIEKLENQVKSLENSLKTPKFSQNS